MRFLFFYIEPISYLLLSGFLFSYTFQDKRARIKILAAIYFLCCLFMLKANFLSVYNSNLSDYRNVNLLTSIGLAFYFHACLLTRWAKRAVLLFVATNIAYYVFYIYTAQHESAFDSFGHVISSLGIVVLVVLFMHQTLTNVTEEPLSSNFDFWFVASQLIYHSGSFVIFLSFGYLTKKITSEYTDKNRLILMQLWSAQSILLFISAIFVAGFVLWFRVKKKRL